MARIAKTIETNSHWDTGEIQQRTTLVKPHTIKNSNPSDTNNDNDRCNNPSGYRLFKNGNTVKTRTVHNCITSDKIINAIT